MERIWPEHDGAQERTLSVDIRGWHADGLLAVIGHSEGIVALLGHTENSAQSGDRKTPIKWRFYEHGPIS